jgi:uncharacterized protein YggE
MRGRFAFSVIIVSLVFMSFSAKAEERVRTISVMGEASVKIAPDKADLSINLAGSGKTAVQAKEVSDKKLKSLYSLIKQHDIPESLVETLHSSIQPQYDYRDGKQKFREYESQQRVTIEIHNLDSIAKFMDDLVVAGVDRVDSLQYGLKDDAGAKQDALVKALHQAQTKAAALAEVVGSTLGKAHSVAEQGAGYRPPSPVRGMMMKSEAFSAADSAIAPPAGDVEVRQKVQAVFELQ